MKVPSPHDLILFLRSLRFSAEYVTTIMSVLGAASAASPTPSGSHFFANAANVGSEISHSFLGNIWVQRMIIIFQTFALPLMYYFRPLCTALALFWYAQPIEYSSA